MFKKNAFSTVLAIGALLAITFGLLIISKPVQAKGEKVEVCHLPPGNLENFHTIDVSVNALGAHLGHGDLAGACNGLCTTLCDDGDACTVDDTGDCEELGCPLVPEPVDCNDGNLCTIDSCDSASGCTYEAVTCEAPDACSVALCDPSTGGCALTPVVCGDGFTCDPVEGCVEEPVDECPCFDGSEFTGALSCGNLDEIISGATGIYVSWDGGNAFACAGLGCVADDIGGNAVGCAINVPSEFMTPTDDDVDALCQQIIVDACD